LLDVGFIKEVYHPDWLTNPVLVPKKNNEWRMCVDYTNLNKACKNDPFGLPWIDQVVDSTSFITPFGAFCCMTMPFGLKSVGKTYQTGIQQCLYSQHGCNVEAYVDDMVVKTQEEEGLISYLTESFDTTEESQNDAKP
jgi:anaerobic selenocysteine-containing dehydrogenase